MCRERRYRWLASRYAEWVLSRLKPSLVHIIWFLGGFTLGGCFVLLIGRGWTANWVSATGQWFGAVVTVLALLWAVRSFRSDQREREASRSEELAGHLARRSEVDAAQLREASNVLLTMRGSAGSGDDGPNATLTSIRIRIQNNSEDDVVVKEITLDDRLIPTRPLPTGFHVKRGEPFDDSYGIVPVPRQQDDLKELELSRFDLSMTYRLGGRDWRRCPEGIPQSV